MSNITTTINFYIVKLQNALVVSYVLFIVVLIVK